MRSLKQRGFTLIEIMVALSIIVVISVTVWESMSKTFDTVEYVDAVRERYRIARLFLFRLSKELRGAFLSLSKKNDDGELLTFFIGKDEVQVDRIDFFGFVHEPLLENAKESDVSEVTYFGVPDRDGTYRILRHENVYPDGEEYEDEKGLVVIDHVKEFDVRYFSIKKNEWYDEWNSRSMDHKEKLPDAVSITLVLKDPDGQDIKFYTEVNLPMHAPIDLRAW